MRLLLVTATSPEIAQLLFSSELAHTDTPEPRLKSYTYKQGLSVDILTTGVGMTATAYWLGRALANGPYDAAFNFGVCGSFEHHLSPGTVVQVSSDCFPELGAQDDEQFLTIQSMGLLGDDEFPFTGGRVVNKHQPGVMKQFGLPEVSGITVNTVHGHVPSIEKVRARFRPQVESMEGAAFLYGCLSAGVRCAQVRAVSNYVERRNRENWKMKEAIGALNDTALKILEGLL